MKFWLDAQLPPSLAVWLVKTFSVEAVPLLDIGLRDASDQEIFFAARQAGAAAITKDSVVQYVRFGGMLFFGPTHSLTSNATESTTCLLSHPSPIVIHR